MVGIAQLVEQRTENPRVTSSNLVPGTRLICVLVSIPKIHFGNRYIFVSGLDHYTYLSI